MTSIRILNNAETKDSIDAWFVQVKAFLRAIPVYAKYMDLVWTSHSASETRGFQNVVDDNNTVTATAETQSTQVGALIDLLCSYAPELDNAHIRSEAVSLLWIYNYIREHYGCKRTGRQMMSKFSTLKRRPNERLNAYWNRWQGFWAENRIRQGDEIKISDGNNIVTAARDEIGERYRLSSDIVACLYFAHEDLPAEVEQMLSHRLETQDVASLQKEIFTKANIALEKLEKTRPSVRRANFTPRRQPQQGGNRRSTQGASSTSRRAPRKPSKPEHFCSTCSQSASHKDQASTHFMKDCPYLSESDRAYILKLYDKALSHRLLTIEEWDDDMTPQFVDLVEDNYGLSSELESRQLALTPADIVNTSGPSDAVTTALSNFGLNASVVLFQDGDIDAITLKRIGIESSPSFTADFKCRNSAETIKQSCIVDSGCTGECIINQKFANAISAEVSPSPVKAAKLADKETSLPIVGMTKLSGMVMGNAFTLNALVSRDGDAVLLGIPAMEKLNLMVNCRDKCLTFNNGASISYRAISCTSCCQVDLSSVNVRRLLLRTPKHQTILPPGNEVQLAVCGGTKDGRYALQPTKQPKHDNNWLVPSVVEIFCNQTTVINDSLQPLAIKGKDFVAEAFPLVKPEELPLPEATDVQTPPPEETSWKDISVDPDNMMPPEVKSMFDTTNETFAAVFRSDLPKYNGAFGTCEAVINVPDNLPQSTRLKDVPWYPKKMLNELQAKFDTLEEKGALVRPQDAGIDVIAVSPSFLVAKKPPSKGYRLVTAFGALAQHVKNPAAPIVSTDQVLRRLSSWRYLIKTDIANAYHQIPLNRDSMRLAGVVTPFKGMRVYTTAAMGMPGSEIALNELTALLFGSMKQSGVLEVLMDDVYIGGDNFDDLHDNYLRFLTICNEADIRLGPSKVVICPAQTEILGWTWKQGGILEINQHSSSRLQQCKPPPTAEGLRGFVGAYKFMAPAIPNFATVLEPLNKAIGDKSKKDPINWTPQLHEDFKRAQDYLKNARPLTMPKPGQQLYMTTDASQSGLGATLHRSDDKAVVKHFSKQLSALKKNWLPCELEALAIGAGLQFFLPFFRESGCKPIIYTDSRPCVLAYNKMTKGIFSSSPRVSTFLHEVLNQGAEIKFLAGSSNLPADHASRNASTCSNPQCQVCAWVNDKESQVVRRLDVTEVEEVLAGNKPSPFHSRAYWRRRQLEDDILKIVAHHLKFGSSPPKNRNQTRVKRYLQPQHRVFLSADNVLMAPSVRPFSNTPRYVVPEASLPALVSIFHHQFGCLAVSPLRELLRRHFFALNLDEAVTSYVASCVPCAAKRDKKHTEAPMSTVTPPEYFGEQYASDVIKRERQKILVLRETATSYTWAKIVKNETAQALESGLRSLFSQVRPPNAARPASCRLDNAPGFKTLALNDCLKDIGVKIDLGNAANINSNPVAEKANRELEQCIITCQPTGGRITSQVLASAVSMLNSRPRWSTMSSYELWTGRDQITGHSLLFDQKHIIALQHKRRLKSHPDVPDTFPDFKPGDLVFNNEEGSKLKARDKLIIQEYLGNGMFRLDRLHDATGNVTRAFLPGRHLYKPGSPATAPSSTFANTDLPETYEQSPTPETPETLLLPSAAEQTTTTSTTSAPHPSTEKSNRNRIPVAPGKSYAYIPPKHEPVYRPFFFTSGSDDTPDFVPSLRHATPLDLPNNSPETTSTDDDMENAFFSANNSEEAHDSSSVSETTSPGIPTPQPEPGDSTPSPENDTQLRRSTRQRQAPPTLVYTEGFHQQLVRTTKHQQRRPPTPVRKHPSQEDRDKVKLKRGKSLQKKPNI